MIKIEEVNKHIDVITNNIDNQVEANFILKRRLTKIKKYITQQENVNELLELYKKKDISINNLQVAIYDNSNDIKHWQKEINDIVHKIEKLESELND